ncbi:MAG TPA: exo-alpha-sialidase, partial [Chloroflexota bacterium]
AFTPTVGVNSKGIVGVTYYDLRNLAAGNSTTLPTDLWLKTSTAGGSSFGADAHVAGSFNLLVAPNAGGFFLGDYESMATIGTSFLPFFVQTNCSDTSCTTNRTDVYAGSF